MNAADGLAGQKALVMGLGLHGGGLETARYLLRHGAQVTVTDLRDEKVLAPSLEKLAGLPVRLVLGRHETADFAGADLVVKNPGVPPTSPFLARARRVETDISLFLAASPARLLAVTGSKGKSGVASALHYVLQERNKGRVFLGGNITVSPLTFLDELKAGDDVVLELSSWQLGDLRGRRGAGEEALLKPRAAVITAIMPDHQDRYAGMEDYVADKRVIYQGQDLSDLTVAGDDAWGRSFGAETGGRFLPYTYAGTPLPPEVAGGWIEGGVGLARLGPGEPPVEAVPEGLLVPGLHQKRNLLAAALALLDLGLLPETVREALVRFPGIEHRLEWFHRAGGVDFYNDTAATVPEASEAAVAAFARPPVLVAGGSDKKLDLSPLVRAAKRAKAVVLLAGSGTDRLLPLLAAAGITYRGPFDTVEAASQAAVAEAATAGDTVVLSPGFASFGMFVNEFDRGRRWKAAVQAL